MKITGRKKGTAWYFSDTITAVTSLVTTPLFLLAGALILFAVNVQLEVNVIGGMMYEGPRADMIMLTYLDSTSDGVQMKDLLAYALFLDSTTWQASETTVIDVKAASQTLMKKITDKPYLLTLDLNGKKTKIAGFGDITVGKTIKTETMIQAGEKSGKLALVMVR